MFSASRFPILKMGTRKCHISRGLVCIVGVPVHGSALNKGIKMQMVICDVQQGEVGA